MQLIMDAEDSSIDIREKMSTLDQESLSDKPVLNGGQDPESVVPNGNKENIETKNNIIGNVSLDNEIKLVDEAVISSSVTEESGDDNKTKNKGSDEQAPDKGNMEEKSIEDIVAEMDSFDDKENTSGEKAKETEKEGKSVIGVSAALENVTEETSCIDDPKETDCKTDKKEKLNKEKEPVSDDEEQKDSEEKVKLTEETGINKNEQKNITEQQENNKVVENSEIDKDNVYTDKSEDNVFEDKEEKFIADEKDDNTTTDQHLQKEVEEEKENVLLQDVNLTVDDSVNKTKNESDNNKTVQSDLEKTDPKTEEISLDIGDSKIDEVEKTEPMETSQLSNISCSEVISSDIISSVVSSENEKKAQNTMDCDEKPTDETEELAQTADSTDKTSEIVTNGIETYTNECKNDEEPMECEQISEISTSENIDASTKTDDSEAVNTNKIEKSKNDNVSDKQSDSDKLENELESKTREDCEITDLIQPICDKKDEESNSMECNDIIGVPEVEKNASISTSQETTDQVEPICNKKDVESNSMECSDIIELPEMEKKNEMITTSQETTDQVEPICNKKDVESNSMECNDIIELPEAEKKNEIKTISQETTDKVEPFCNKKDVESNSMECIDILEVPEAEKKDDIIITQSESKVEVLDMVEMKEMTEDKKEEPVKADSVVKNQDAVQKEPETKPLTSTPTIKLSNTLDILSDDEDEPPKASETPKHSDDKCIDIEDDDDIMLIDDVDDTNSKDGKEITDVVPEATKETETKTNQNTINIDHLKENKSVEESVASPKTELDTDAVEPVKPEVYDKEQEEPPEKIEKLKPLVPEDFFKSYRKDLADMTRDDLEEFCILKIVESIIDRSSLNEIRSKLKTMAQSIDEYKKKALMLTKQNRDLQVVLKSVQEEQKKVSDTQITPLKITRSVGMQVYMTEKNTKRKVIPTVTNLNVRNSRTRPPNTNTIPRPQKTVNNQQIPVPRLVPANNITVSKASNLPPSVPNIGKVTSPLPNGIKNSTPPPKAAEKRPHNRIQSDTVDLTDDEPPAKMTSRNPTPPVRLVSPQNLLATRQPFPQSGSFNSPRKVYIPISGPQAQVRPGQTIMLKSVPSSGPRQRGPAPMVRMPQNSVRMQRVQNNRHPAPLPDAMKQYQPPNWKALPPAPDLKLSKVENGIVISWKIDGYQEDSYEEIASYQLYAYQETSSPPNTSLWKKIGDVKALPLPMACTLTQFMAGYKYFFAVRAVDIRSRLGPFSLPGSILLLNKM